MEIKSLVLSKVASQFVGSPVKVLMSDEMWKSGNKRLHGEAAWYPSGREIRINMDTDGDDPIEIFSHEVGHLALGHLAMGPRSAIGGYEKRFAPRKTGPWLTKREYDSIKRYDSNEDAAWAWARTNGEAIRKAIELTRSGKAFKIVS